MLTSSEHLAGVKDIIQPRIEHYAEVIETAKAMTQNHSRSNHVPTENSEAANF